MRVFSRLNPTKTRRRIAHKISSFRNGLPLLGAGKNYQRFIILTTGRSGSNLLIQRCESHPNIACFGEIFNGHGIQWNRIAGSDSRDLRDFRDVDPYAFLNSYIWQNFPRTTCSVGFKLLHAQYFLHASKLRPIFLSIPELQIIFLKRENSLRVLLAIKRAKLTGVHHITHPEERPLVPPITLSPKECLDHFRRTIASETLLEHTFGAHPALKLTYEKLVSHPSTENRRICDFLGVDKRPLINRSIRIAPAPLRDQIANFDELRDAFNGSEWNRFLDDEN